MSSGRVYVLKRRQRLELPVQRAFEFYAQARNLAVITPPWMGFEVITPGPIEMPPGALIDYRLKLHGVPVRWRTRIVVWKPPLRFLDVQVRGPYALWEHTHTFEPDGEQAVLIGDRVRYAMPLPARAERSCGVCQGRSQAGFRLPRAGGGRTTPTRARPCALAEMTPVRACRSSRRSGNRCSLVGNGRPAGRSDTSPAAP